MVFWDYGKWAAYCRRNAEMYFRQRKVHLHEAPHFTSHFYSINIMKSVSFVFLSLIFLGGVEILQGQKNLLKHHWARTST